MDARLSRWEKSFRRSVIPQVLDHGPKVTMGVGVTMSLTWWGAVEAQSSSGRLSLHSHVFIFAIALVVVGFIAWVARVIVNDKKRTENTTTLTAEEVMGVRTLLASKGKEAPMTVTGTATIPIGGILATAVGVGPVTVTVPSGGPYGADPDKPFEFTTNSDPQRIVLAEGGTVTPAYLSGSINSESTVSGQLTILEEDDDE